jgi:RNA polymerase sigma-70 factor, ECF subfamily
VPNLRLAVVRASPSSTNRQARADARAPEGPLLSAAPNEGGGGFDVRNRRLANDDKDVGEHEAAGAVRELIAVYERALPQVYGYLLPRCGSVAAAEDITAETFLAAADALERGTAPHPTVAWLIGVARHKLVDHWRSAGREERNLAVAASTSSEVDDPWSGVIDSDAVHAVLARLPAPQRTVLVLRYLDGMSVAEVAEHVGRSLHATETLLVRARAALRHLYLQEHGDDC